MSEPTCPRFTCLKIIFFSFHKKRHVVGTQLKCLNEMLLTVTHSIFSSRNEQKIYTVDSRYLELQGTL